MPIYKDGNIKKDGKQKYRVCIRCKDLKGNAKQVERIVYGINEAKEELEKLKVEYSIEEQQKKIIFKDALKVFYSRREYEVRITTHLKHQSIMNIYVEPYFNDYCLGDITPDVVQRWKDEINKTNLSIITKKHIYNALSVFLNYCVRMDYIPTSPLNKVPNFVDKNDIPKEMDFYTPEEFRLFITAAKNQAIEQEKLGDLYEWNYYVFFNIAFYIGARKGEINALTWSDITSDNCLKINKSVTQKLKTGDKKTYKTRVVKMPKALVDILEEHKKRCFSSPSVNMDSPITNKIRDSTIWKKSNKYSQLAQVKQIRIHDFRHSHATVLFNAKVNIKEISRRLGHASVQMTINTYSHLYREEEDAAINVLDNLF